MRNDELSRDHLSHRLLRVLAQRLNARGIETRELRYGDEVIEIAAINPDSPDRSGRVVVGDDGYLVWESWTDFKSDTDAHAAAEIVHALLTGNHIGRRAGLEDSREPGRHHHRPQPRRHQSLQKPQSPGPPARPG